MFLNGLFGSESAELTLLFLENYESGYAKKIADTYELPISQFQKQLQKFEHEGILSSRLVGKTRLYTWNPRYLFLTELRALLKKALKFVPEEQTQKFFRMRMRPRRAGKPL